MTHQTGIHGKRGPGRTAGSRRSFPAAAPGCAGWAPRVAVGGSAADPSAVLRGFAHPLSPSDARTRLGTAKVSSTTAAPLWSGVCAAGGPCPAIQQRAERHSPAVSPKSQRGEGCERRGASPPLCVLPAASRRRAAF